MSEDIEPVAQTRVNAPPTNKRIIAIMAVLGLLGTFAGIIFVSAAFGIGLAIGVLLAFVNYFWLRHSLQRIFEAADSGERPRMLAGRYFLRYLILGVAVAVIYVSGWVPITSVLIGMAGIGFAVIIEGIIRIFAGGPRSANLI